MVWNFVRQETLCSEFSYLKCSEYTVYTIRIIELSSYKSKYWENPKDFLGHWFEEDTPFTE